MSHSVERRFIRAAKCSARLIPAFVLLVLAGCAGSPYGPSTIFGGYTDEWLSNGEFSVRFDGNGYTTELRAHDLAELRAAEICLAGGQPGLVVSSHETRTNENYALRYCREYGSVSSTTSYTPHSVLVASCRDQTDGDDVRDARVIQADTRARYELGAPESADVEQTR